MKLYSFMLQKHCGIARVNHDVLRGMSRVKIQLSAKRSIPKRWIFVMQDPVPGNFEY